MIQTSLTGQCPHCGAPAWRLAYHSRYTLVRKTFCDRFGTAFYDLKTPEEKVQRAIQRGVGRTALSAVTLASKRGCSWAAASASLNFSLTLPDSGSPILLRVDYDAGHGIGATKQQINEELADTYAFLFQQLGGATQ